MTQRIADTGEWMCLTARQRALIVLLSSGMSQREAREQLAYPDRAWYQSLQDEAFRRCLSMASYATMEEGVRWGAARYREVLERLHAEAVNPDNPPGVRVRAQQAFLDRVSRDVAWSQVMVRASGERLEAPAVPELPEWAKAYAARSGS